jgi:hypothetical protein
MTVVTTTTTMKDSMTTRLRRFFCGLRGHDRLKHFAGRRVMMRCTRCGHDTPGWDTGHTAPRAVYEGDPRRHRIPNVRLARRKTA